MNTSLKVSRQESQKRQFELHVQPKSPQTSTGERLSSRDILFAVGILLLSIIVRAEAVMRHGMTLDSDEAIVGLMAKHIFEGRDVPIFYYGQHYMGSFEALLASLSFTLFGLSVLSLKLIPFIFSLILVFLVGAVAYGVAPEKLKKESALMAALLCALPATPLVLWSAKARGGFMEILVLGAVASLLTIQWLKTQKSTFFRTSLIGFVLGFGWWTNNQIIFFMAPIGLFMLLHSVRYHTWSSTTVHLLLGTTAFFLGGLPFWMYNVNNSFASFEIFGSSADVVGNASGFVTSALPMILGARLFWHSQDIFPGASLFVALLFCTLFFVVLVHRRKQAFALFRGRIDNQAPVEFLFVLFFTTCAAFVLSSFGSLSSAPRYLLPLYVVLYPLVGITLALIKQVSRSCAAGLLVALLAIHLYALYGVSGTLAGEPLVYKGERVQRDHQELIAWLADHNISYIRTNYWIGYRLAFETEEKIIFSVFQEPKQVRVPEYESVVSLTEHDRSPFVLTPRQSIVVAQGLTTLGYTFKRDEVGGYVVLSELQPPHLRGQKVPASNLSVTTSHNSAHAPLVLDEKSSTRWGSAAPQTPGMWVEVSFAQPSTLSGLSYRLDSWSSDYPRGLEISCNTIAGKQIVLLNNQQYAFVQYLQTGFRRTDGFLELSFASPLCSSVRLTQLSSHPVLDWSISDLIFYTEGDPS